MAAKTTRNTPHHVGNSSVKFTKDGAGQMRIPPKDLNIVWGSDSRYWSVPVDDSPAVLNQVYWLEVTGSVEGIQPDKEYEVRFRVSLTPDAFGFGGSPLYVMARRGKDGKSAWSKALLDMNQTGESYIEGKLTKPDPNQGQDDQSKDRKLYFGLFEVWSGKWKGGLKIHDIIIRELP